MTLSIPEGSRIQFAQTTYAPFSRVSRVLIEGGLFMNNKGYSRKHYFIDKEFQTKFILRFCGVVVVSSLLIGILIFLLSQNSTTVAIENTQVRVKTTADFILPVLVQTIIVVSILK